jgi:hypothetical protein
MARAIRALSHFALAEIWDLAQKMLDWLELVLAVSVPRMTT